ncbi:hypothetical protein AWZ03_012955 [Drosophila navojoa]|uniref:Uncharacterized protein n=1 Tax=Drosophila navojoa TaxID=7232 RepID=A0A484AXQ0_DRONA|nr:uncharacterized protein LOC108656950 [Drosophila navojoa]TDG40620.1 hypothetical protein AWZ03_012955 [Drosophila navojoa]
MDFGRDNNQDFFEKLHSTDGPRNLRQIFEDDDKPLLNESSNLRYQPQSSTKQQEQQNEQQQQDEQQQQQSPTPQLQEKLKGMMIASISRNKRDVMAVESWSTVVAKVAHGFNGSENVGRVGVALSRNGAGAAKLVVYKSRTQLLSTLLLTKSAQSSSPRIGSANVILRESYMQFYDDEQHFWSLRFEVAKDEEEFTAALMKLGLPIEELRINEVDKSSNDPLSTSNTLPQAQLAPALRQKISETSGSLANPEALPRTFDSESESPHSTEDSVTTHRARSFKYSQKTLPAKSTKVSLPKKLDPNKSSATPSSKLELYLDEQRATGHAMDKKMDTILQAMCRLTSNSNLPLKESSGDSMVVSIEHKDSRKLDSILQAMSRVANNSGMQQLGESLDTTRGNTDNEDELLELEQKLLDFKKENRSLMKSLRAKEQALADLRASTCALCEELLAQNSELKQQNTALIAAMTNQSSSTSLTAIVPVGNSAFTVGDCENCEKYLTKISGLERRLSTLQSALLNYTASGQTTPAAAATTTATTTSLSTAQAPPQAAPPPL